MAARIPWSREEFSLVLRAWADVAASKPRNLGRAIFLRYEALCGETGAPIRPEPSVLIKRQLMQNMHAVISLFLVSIAAAEATSTVAGCFSDDLRPMSTQYSSCPNEGGGDAAATDAATINGGGGGGSKLHAWFSMSKAQRRRWFNDHNDKTYAYMEITDEQVGMITEILKTSNGGVMPPPLPPSVAAVYAKRERKAKREAAPESDTETTRSENELNIAMVRTREQFRVVMERFQSTSFASTASMKEDNGPAAVAAPVVYEEEKLQEVQAVTPPLPPQPPQPQISDPVAEENGSDTESDGDWEEIVPRSPIREADEENDVITVSKQVSTEPLSTDKVVLSDVPTGFAGNESQKCKLNSAEFVHSGHKRPRPVHPEILNLLNALQKQTRNLREEFRNAKLARKRDQADRQQVLRLMRQEQNERRKILEGLRNQEQEVRLQQEAWRQEQDEMMREFAQDLPSPPP